MYFNPMEPDGFTMYVMQSAEYTDKILTAAERYNLRGASAGNSIKMAMLTNHIEESDLTDSDIDIINDWIEENN